MLRRVLTLLLAMAVCPAAMAETAGFPAPSALPETEGLPELMRMSDGTPVATAADWEQRRAELLALYSEYMYGWWPDPAGERVTWTLDTEPETGCPLLTVSVAAGEKTASFSVLVALPEGAPPEGGFPWYLEYTPWHFQNWITKEWMTAVPANCLYAASRGYAGISYDCSQVAQDAATWWGAFYTLYPYERFNGDPRTQRGTLLAWAWGVSKVIDALENGAGEALGINPALSVVGGVSRYGKSVAVAAAYEPRIRVAVPSCSGAGGVAVYRMGNHGKTYDLTGLGGSAAWTNDSQNEPFGNLKGGEGYWFCGNFKSIATVRNLPVDQHMLCALAAGPDRHLIIVTGIESEGWNNTEGQCLAYAAAKPAWELLGCGDQIRMLIHLNGHAILPEDIRQILDYCDAKLLGREDVRVAPMDGSLFLVDNRDRLDPLFAPYLP